MCSAADGDCVAKHGLCAYEPGCVHCSCCYANLWGFVKECTADELCLCPEGACTAGFDEFLVCFLRHAELPRHPSDGALRFEPLVHQGERRMEGRVSESRCSLG